MTSVLNLFLTFFHIFHVYSMLLLETKLFYTSENIALDLGWNLLHACLCALSVASSTFSLR